MFQKKNSVGNKLAISVALESGQNASPGVTKKVAALVTALPTVTIRSSMDHQ